MYQTSDIRKGLKVEMDNAPWVVVEFQFVKPGKGQAFTRTKFKNMLHGNTVERNLRSGEALVPADVEDVNATYLYADAEAFHFMNTDTYEQTGVPKEVLGDQAGFLLEEMPCRILFYKNRPVSVEIPTFVELEITYCEPGSRGNTATGGAMKPATVTTGAEVMVPLFINQGEIIRIDTRDGQYVERVNRK